MLKIDVEPRGNVVILHCFGRIVLGLECEMLRTIAMSRSEKYIEINLASTKMVDAAGLGLFVELTRQSERDGRKIMFTTVDRFIWHLVRLTKLYQILSICPAQEPEVREKPKPCLARDAVDEEPPA